MLRQNAPSLRIRRELSAQANQTQNLIANELACETGQNTISSAERSRVFVAHAPRFNIHAIVEVEE